MPLNTLVSDCFDQLITQKNGNQTQEDAAAGIECAIEDVVRTEQLQTLVHERGECGETAAEAHCEEKFQIGVEHITAVEDAIKDSDEQATEDIHHHRAHRKRCDDAPLQKLGQKETSHRTESSAKSHK